MTQEDTWIVQHLAAALRLRLFELKDAEFVKVAHLDTSEAGIERAALAAFEALKVKERA